MFHLYSVEDGRCVGKADFLLEDFLSHDTTRGTSSVTVVSPDHQQPIGMLHRESYSIETSIGIQNITFRSELPADKLGKGSPRSRQCRLGRTVPALCPALQGHADVDSGPRG